MTESPAKASEDPAGMTWEQANGRRLRLLAIALLAVGLCWRIVRYLLQFPIWGDEAMLCLNFLDHDYAGLTRELHNCQIAPILFLWGQLSIIRVLGASELAVRLLPFLAGLGSLVLFWQLARLTLSPLARTLAVGILAVSIFSVSMGTLAKPYAFDMLAALLLLVPAVSWLRRPERVGPLAILCLAAPGAMLMSYPASFIGGAVSLAILPAAWRQRGWKIRSLYVLYNLAMLGGFLVSYRIGAHHLDTVTNANVTRAGMETYWAEGFPPRAPLPLLQWFFLIHTGQMTAYPVGASNGGSILTVLLCLVGLWQFWQQRRRALLVLCLAPFALGLIAAALHGYPYGAAARLSQHVVPSIVLTAAAGAAALVLRFRDASTRWRWTVGVCALLATIGIVGLVRDAIRPYRADRGELDRWMRQVTSDLFARANPGDALVVVNDSGDPVLTWHLNRRAGRVTWENRIDPAGFHSGTGHVWLFHFGPGAGPTRPPDPAGSWAVREQFCSVAPANHKGWPAQHCDLYHWVCGPNDSQARGK